MKASGQEPTSRPVSLISHASGDAVLCLPQFKTMGVTKREIPREKNVHWR
jgi:hypothetical protein